VKNVGGSVVENRSLQDWLAQPEIHQFVEKKVLKKFRAQHGCLGPNFEKDAPAQKFNGKSMRCSDFLTYQGAIAKSESLSKICKRECLKGKVKSATGKSAAALETCLTDSCEKTCDFKSMALKTEIDSFLKGTIDQHGLDAESM
jgi:hypothetical protein